MKCPEKTEHFAKACERQQEVEVYGYLGKLLNSH